MWSQIMNLGFITPGGLDSPGSWNYFSPLPIGSQNQTPGGRAFEEMYDVCIVLSAREMVDEGFNLYYTVPEGDFVVTTPVWIRYILTAYSLRNGEWLYLRPFSNHHIEEGTNPDRTEASQEMWSGTISYDVGHPKADASPGNDWGKIPADVATNLFGEKNTAGRCSGSRC